MTIYNCLQLAHNLQLDLLDTEVLLAHSVHQNKSFLYSHPKNKLTFWQRQKFLRLAKKRAAGVPVAYLTGKKEFYGLEFIVNHHTLIPRPETEMIVDEALKQITSLQTNQKRVKFIDIGTGSGCIPIAILKSLVTRYSLPIPQIIATDISSSALCVARRNAKAHGLDKKIKFSKSDLLNNIFDSFFATPDYHLIITANLPYLSAEIYLNNFKNLKFEPRSALESGHDGLYLYERLLVQIEAIEVVHPLPLTLFFEINPDQSGLIQKIISQHCPQSIIKIQSDLAGKNRLVTIKLYQ